MTTLYRIAQDDIEDIIVRADNMGVDLDVHITPDGDIWLGQITRREGIAGAGRRVVEMLCELADSAQVSIALVVIEWLDSVIAIYADCGFEQAEYECRAIEDDYIFMRRQPC